VQSTDAMRSISIHAGLDAAWSVVCIVCLLCVSYIVIMLFPLAYKLVIYAIMHTLYSRASVCGRVRRLSLEFLDGLHRSDYYAD